ncbi:MAG: hypothetical protein JXB14_01340 [Candidatus Altiarchaeota archaeon]|nr:hypothetical protein [Candidatus Altiarchaeota archaeon]
MAPDVKKWPKVPIAIFVVAVAILVILLLVPLGEKPERHVIPPPEKICDFPNDYEAHVNAVENKYSKTCGCIEDKAKREKCEAAVDDIVTYERAIGTLDASLCFEISDVVIKDACKSVVMSGASQIK